MMNDPDIIAWLESPEGERWSYLKHSQLPILVSLKDDTHQEFDSYLWHR